MGSSQPLSNSSRCQRRAQSGMCDTDFGRSNASAAARHVLVEEGDELRAECLDIGIKGELHGTPR